MKSTTMLYIAMAITILYGCGFAFISSHQGTWVVVGAIVCAAAWVGFGMLRRQGD